MKPNSHQVAATNLPDKFLGASPPPWKSIYNYFSTKHFKKNFSHAFFIKLCFSFDLPVVLVRSCKTYNKDYRDFSYEYARPNIEYKARAVY